MKFSVKYLLLQTSHSHSLKNQHKSQKICNNLQQSMSKFVLVPFQSIVAQWKKEIWLNPMTKVPTHTETKSNVTTQKRHQKLRWHNDCGPTEDGQLE